MSGSRQASFLALLSAQRVLSVPATLTPLTAGSIIPTHDTNTNLYQDLHIGRWYHFFISRLKTFILMVLLTSYNTLILYLKVHYK